MRIVPYEDKRYLIDGASADVLRALYRRGQLEDGDLPSKSGRDYLLTHGLISQTASMNFWGYTLTLAGAAVEQYIIDHPIRTLISNHESQVVMFDDDEYLVSIRPPLGDGGIHVTYPIKSEGGGYKAAMRRLDGEPIVLNHEVSSARFQKALYALRERWASVNILGSLWVLPIPRP